RWLWRHDHGGDFSVRSAYKLLTSMNNPDIDALSPFLWHKQMSPIPYRTISLISFTRLEVRVFAVLLCSLFGYVVFGLCGTKGTIEYLRLRRLHLTRCYIRLKCIPFGG
ncbi:hypothetical protein A2U01_0034261, partial [Trifolium medium]|nr:hypothetical protein [Trifolium medium]